ncbi:hypothetical protein F0U62_16090 [Cystobacter fuscus]|uniref:hypothetical protein n=1 Tax=Cystobacter fuscus TaxID=43 RepID=UPI002B2C9E27|nr:hypothetical protein F0U62_16090 [Cystobacter fuscus]
MKLLEREFPALAGLVYTYGDSYRRAELRMLGNVLRHYFDARISRVASRPSSGVSRPSRSTGFADGGSSPAPCARSARPSSREHKKNGRPVEGEGDLDRLASLCLQKAARRKRKLVDSDIVREILERQHSPSLA